MTRKHWTISVLAAVLFALSGGLSPSAQAEETTAAKDVLPRLTIDPGLEIRKRWAKDAEYIGTIRLTANHQEMIGVQVLPSDLKGNADQADVPRNRISVESDIKLRKGESSDLEIRVKGIAEPGIYSGFVELREPGQPPNPALKIPLKVIAFETPSLERQAGSKTLQMSLANCSFDNCWLAKLLLPEGAFADTRDLHLRNPGAVPVVVNQVTILARGKVGDQQLTSNELGLSEVGGKSDDQQQPSNELTLSDSKISLAAKQISELPLTIERSAMAPDRYTGSLELDLEGNETVSIPIDITVRSGPALAVIIVFIGIFLGRLVKFMEDRGGPQADALDAVNDLSVDLQGLHENDQAILAPQLNEVRQSVYDERLNSVASELQAIRDRMDTLVQVRRIEGLLAERTEVEAVKIVRMIDRLRNEIRFQQDASASYQAVVDAFLALRHTEGEGLPSAALAEVKRAATVLGAVKARVIARENQTPKAPWRRSTQRALSFTFGVSNEFRAKATFWFARPLLSFVLIAMLAVVGLETYYVNEGATFGADGMFDYTGLLIWGLSADVAGRTLSSLRGRNKRPVKGKAPGGARA